jgi:hypothetical protein
MDSDGRHLPLDQRRQVIHVVRHVGKARRSVCTVRAVGQLS